MKRERPSYFMPSIHCAPTARILIPQERYTQELPKFKYLKNLYISRKLSHVTEIPKLNLLVFSRAWIEIWNSKTLKCVRRIPNIQTDSLKLFGEDTLIGISHQKHNSPSFIYIKVPSFKVEIFPVTTISDGFHCTSIRCFDYMKVNNREYIYYAAYDNKIHVYDLAAKKNTPLCNLKTGLVHSIKADKNSGTVLVLSGNYHAPTITLFSMVSGSCLVEYCVHEHSQIESDFFGFQRSISQQVLEANQAWKCTQELTEEWAIPVTDSLVKLWMSDKSKRESLKKLFSNRPMGPGIIDLQTAINLLRRTEWFVIPTKKNQVLLKFYLPEQGCLRKIGFLEIDSKARRFGYF